MPKVFISYSHDSPEHSARVLEFANALRAYGVDAELDQYHVRPEHGWPHWCAEQLREENSAFVLLVCTETYRQRVENKVAADEGRGVYWEGAIIYDYLYDAKGNRRFIPMLLDGAQADVPQPIRNHTRYSIAAFNLDDDGYQKLYRELTGQPAIVKPPLGKPIVLGPASPILPALPVRAVKTQFASPVATVRVSLEKLPASGRNFLGREASNNHAFDPHLDEPWTQESADGLKTEYNRRKHTAYIYDFAIIVAVIFLLKITNTSTDLNSFSSFSDFRWDALWLYLSVVILALFGIHITGKSFEKFFFHCPFCHKTIYPLNVWICPYCDHTNHINNVYTFLSKCWKCKNASPAHRCPHCKQIIPLRFKAGTKMFSRFSDDTSPDPQQP